MNQVTPFTAEALDGAVRQNSRTPNEGQHRAREPALVAIPRPRHFYELVLLIHGLLFVGTMAYAMASPLPPGSALYPLCVGTLAMAVWIVCTLPYIQRDVFNLYSLFLLSLVLFNSGRIILEVFGLNQDEMLPENSLHSTWTRTVLLVLVSLAGFHFGGLLSAQPFRPMRSLHFAPTGTQTSSTPTRTVGQLILLITIGPFLLLTLNDIQVVMTEGYFGLFARERVYGIDTGAWGVLTNIAAFMLPGLLFFFAGSKDQPSSRNLIFFLLIAYALMQLFLGRRSWGTMSLFSAIWMWHVLVRPVPIRKIVVFGLIMLFVVFPAISATRSETGRDRLSYERIRDAYFSIENPGVTILSEMGYSMRCIGWTLELVPDTRPFEYGRTYAYATTAVLPNLFWDIHPSKEHGNLGNWISMTIAPSFWELGGGLGYSCIAEAYVNFGWHGAPLAMLLVGYLIGKATRWGARGSPASKAVIAVCIAYILFWARGDVTLFIRPIFWGAITPYLLVLHLQRKERKRHLLREPAPSSSKGTNTKVSHSTRSS